MDTPRDAAPRRLLEESNPPPASPKLFTNADDAVAVKGVAAVQEKKERSAHSLSFSWRSYVAGGIAGCAVRHVMPEGRVLCTLITLLHNHSANNTDESSRPKQ